MYTDHCPGFPMEATFQPAAERFTRCNWREALICTSCVIDRLHTEIRGQSTSYVPYFNVLPGDNAFRLSIRHELRPPPNSSGPLVPLCCFFVSRMAFIRNRLPLMVLRAQHKMKGVDHWAVSDDPSLLFDTVHSELSLLNVDDARLMEDIYKDNGSGWIKIGVVRDPVTRLLSAYLDLVHVWPSVPTRSSSHDHDPHQPRYGLRSGHGWDWLDAIRKHREMREDASEGELSEGGQLRKTRAPRKSGYDARSLNDTTVPAVPTFEELVDMLGADLEAVPSSFRPVASLCGMWRSPFDTIIPFETLQVCVKRTRTQYITLQLRRTLHTLGFLLYVYQRRSMCAFGCFRAMHDLWHAHHRKMS